MSTIHSTVPAAAAIIDVTDPENVTYSGRHQYHAQDDGPRFDDLAPHDRKRRADSANMSPAQRMRHGFPAVLDRATLQCAAPSIFADAPWDSMSARYKFVPTSHVLDIMADQDMLPVRAAQSRSRIPGKGDFTKHMIRFRHRRDIMLGSNVGPVRHHIDRVNALAEIPETVLVNSHDGSSAYSLWAGIMRLVCTNGLMVDGATLGSLSVRHSGGSDFDARIIEATHTIIESTPATLRAIEGMKQIELRPEAATIFAEAALELKDEAKLRPSQILSPRREADRKPDLWTTFNRVQENVMKGGLDRRTEGNRRSTTRAVKSVGEETRLNRALWTLAEKMAQLAG